MAFAKAKGLICGLKWYHLGFAFFWAVTFVALADPSDDLQADYFAFSMCRQAAALVSCVALAVFTRRFDRFSPSSAITAGVMLSSGSLMYYLAFFFGEYSVASNIVSACLTGGATGWFYVMWQSFYASEGSTRTMIYIPLSAALSVGICVFVTLLPLEWMVLCAVIVLPSIASWTLRKSLAEIEPYEVIPASKFRLRRLLRDMWKPVFCVCAIGFVWQIVGYLGPGFVVEGSDVTAMAGMSCAAVAVACAELFSKNGIDVLRGYQVVFPLITGAFLLPTFFGGEWLEIVSAFTMFGFEVVNLLLLITCAVYASRYAMDSTLVYATCVCPTLLSLLMGDMVGQSVSSKAILDFALVVDTLFVCVYVLSVAMFLVSVGRGKRERKNAGGVSEMADGRESVGEMTASANVRHLEGGPVIGESRTEASVSEESGILRNFAQNSQHLDSDIAQERAALETETGFSSQASSLVEPLSIREREVVELILHGNTVPAISRKLFISENTVRSHFKSIYRKLGVHSKQELIDLFG